MNGVQKRGLQAGYKCITLYMRFWLLLLIIIIIIIITSIIIIIMIIIVIIVFQLKQSAIIKQVLIGLAYVAWARNYLITRRARETRKGERRPPLIFSASPAFSGARYAGYDWPYSGTWRGRTRGAGDEGSSGSKMRKSRHLCKFQTMISSSMRKLHYGPLWYCG